MRRFMIVLSVAALAAVAGCTPTTTPSSTTNPPSTTAAVSTTTVPETSTTSTTTTSTTTVPVQALREVFVSTDDLQHIGLDSSRYPADAAIVYRNIRVQTGVRSGVVCVGILSPDTTGDFVELPNARTCGTVNNLGSVTFDALTPIPLLAGENRYLFRVVQEPSSGAAVTGGTSAQVRW